MAASVGEMGRIWGVKEKPPLRHETKLWLFVSPEWRLQVRRYDKTSTEQLIDSLSQLITGEVVEVYISL